MCRVFLILVEPELNTIHCFQVLTRAHEKEFGVIDDKNKPIWQVAEEREDFKNSSEGNANK